LIDSERNAAEIDDQQGSKGQMLLTSFKIWNIWDKIFALMHLHWGGTHLGEEACRAHESGLLAEERTA
jgi:hypothetical protein